jgi:hypothetical protein
MEDEAIDACEGVIKNQVITGLDPTFLRFLLNNPAESLSMCQLEYQLITCF